MEGGGTKPPRGPVTPVLRKKGSGPAARTEGASRRSCLLVAVRGGAGAPCGLGGVVVVAVRTLKKPPGEKRCDDHHRWLNDLAKGGR
jgi:hypothetical protein